jgi:hypothetical protein
LTCGGGTGQLALDFFETIRSMRQALPGAPVLQPTSAATRTALAIGTVGRVGEELINCLLESPVYSSVTVAVEARLQSMLPRLHPWQLPAAALDDAWRFEAAQIVPPRTDDVFCCISDARSYFKRDQAYVRMRAEQVLSMARLAARHGSQRFILVSPLSAFLQLSVQDGLMDLRELELTRLEFDSLIIVRPSAEFGGAQGKLLERLIGWGAKAIMQIMIPQRLQPLRAREIAQAAVNAAHTLGGGVHIVGGDKIAELAAPGVPSKAHRIRL